MAWKPRIAELTLVLQTLVAVALAAVFAGSPAAAQSHAEAKPEFETLTSSDRTFQVRYPKSLVTCTRRDGENPDVWSPQDCAADLPVCDNSGRAGNVVLCLAYPASAFQGSELQAAAFAASTLDNFTERECTQKWPRSNTSGVHSEQIAGLKFQVAKAVETAASHSVDQHIYRIVHDGACYELDVNLSVALDSAFAAEDAPKKLTAAEREKIKRTLTRALEGFRFRK